MSTANRFLAAMLVLGGICMGQFFFGPSPSINGLREGVAQLGAGMLLIGILGIMMNWCHIKQTSDFHQ
ncbi:MAG: hypothetical protein JWM46_556 [Candidatus Kaiserbacteria bacterium]|nr:hypothetical protein [Candidatus Kaiserbacteria bacterium]